MAEAEPETDVKAEATEEPAAVPASEFPELTLLDELIRGLESLITEADETPLSIDTRGRPRRAVYRIMAATSPSDRKALACDAVYLDAKRLVLRCNNTEVVRLTPLEVMVLAEKSGRGETLAIIRGKARELRRIRGGYDIDVDIIEMRKTRITPSQKLRECILKSDPTGWNRWCGDIRDSIELMGMDLRSADLSGYDLSCADLGDSNLSQANLSGAILAGADLSGCVMEATVLTGADLFRARMNREHAALAQQSGMPEMESILFEGNS